MVHITLEGDLLDPSNLNESKLALDDMTVLDLSQIMAGPYCTMVLADLGANVIKVENPAGGDQTRTSWGRPEPGRDSRAFAALNRNKKSITLNLKDQGDLEKFYSLVAEADVLIENFRPGVAARLGVDYDSLLVHNPGLIYAGISGFGQDGPYSDRPGYDLIAQAMAGVMSITGHEGGPPTKSGLPVADLGAGLFASIGILSAWAWKKRTGEGQFIETSLFESAIALSVWESVEYWGTGQSPKPLGSANRMSAPYQALATSDGHLVVGANNEKLWQLLCQVIGAESLLKDSRFTRNMDRMDNIDQLVPELEARLQRETTDTWVHLLLEAGVPAGPLQDYAQVFSEDPHVKARGMVSSVEHPVEGTMPVVSSPLRMTGTPPSVRRHAPMLGEHNNAHGIND